MIKRLKKKWGINSNAQLVVIFIVFAITGSVSAKLATPLLNFLGVEPMDFVEVSFGESDLHAAKDIDCLSNLPNYTYTGGNCFFSIRILLGI